jgi:hypothetical protein
MPVYRPMGREIVEHSSFITRSQFPTEDNISYLIAPVEGTGVFRDFDPVGFGTPLNIVLRRVYTGQYPEESFLSRRKHMLVSSAVRDITTTSAGARALNILKQSVSSHSVFSGPDAAEEGTTLVYYTPAVASPFITISLTLIFEKFDQELFNYASKLFGNLAGVPIFMPATGYLLGASTVLKLAGNVGSEILNGTPVLNENLQLDFSFGGGGIPKSGFWILSSEALDVTRYHFDPDKGLIDASNSSPYDGPDPVIVVTIDGKAINGVSSFTPLLASASLLGRFFNQKDGSEVAMDTVLESVKLYNDLAYRKKAEETKNRLAQTAPGSPDRKKLEDQLKAFNQNIGEERLRLDDSFSHATQQNAKRQIRQRG